MTGVEFDKGIECSRTGRDGNSEREREVESFKTMREETSLK